MRSNLMLEAARNFSAEQVQKTPQNVVDLAGCDWLPISTAGSSLQGIGQTAKQIKGPCLSSVYCCTAARRHTA
jgi:hypothetical protein